MLEPHRLRHLLRVLETAPGTSGHVFLTTHSPIPLQELDADYVYVVRSHQGTTTSEQVGSGLQDLTRSNPEALLARRVVVCEGKTEMGLCMGLADHWANENSKLPVAHTGTTFAYGGGASNCGHKATKLAGLNYDTALLADSDCPIDPPETDLHANGVSVFLWPGNVCIEQRIALDLPLPDLQQMVNLAIANSSEQVVIDSTSSRLSSAARLTSPILDDWLAKSTEDDVRLAFGTAAHEKKWFKDISRGIELAKIVATALPNIPTTCLARTLKAMADWMYGD